MNHFHVIISFTIIVICVLSRTHDTKKINNPLLIHGEAVRYFRMFDRKIYFTVTCGV